MNFIITQEPFRDLHHFVPQDIVFYLCLRFNHDIRIIAMTPHHPFLQAGKSVEVLLNILNFIRSQIPGRLETAYFEKALVAVHPICRRY